MKKYLLGLIMVSFILFASSAQAAWYTVSVVNVGADNTTVNLRITDSGGRFTAIWVQASGATANEIMATALTAMSLGKKMLVNLDGIVAWSNLKGAYLVD